MHKTKDGKIIASLTEVKNKTGDIFAIVDEFGEISLTSYNKVRYKITKVDITDILSIEQKETPTPKEKKAPAPKKKTEKSELLSSLSERVNDSAPEPIKDEASAPMPVPEEPKEQKLFEHQIAIQEWDRNDKLERRFVDEAVKPLIS